ncbi:cyanophycin metabolism-associated DUF1854 family protein [Noviherbaspirillum sp. Root189]|uniref:cyanophycin metabolism-associated DUF1854 family protein n=1 Tax=Noviherbaspirillum sp. Root189 TaxID=1736487 RepID=UPI0007103556|nr:DUF1854 domain-containing protein [Noviherbaspirillum sp. Root189]KRB94250.1 hypothetical protein ASE07_01625 [Noviherbaspirillum sp. Root189]
MSNFTLSRNAFGKLVFTSPEGVHEGVVPVRAFPIAAPDEGIALVDIDGHELAWIDRLADLPGPVRELLEEELKSREFLPVIKRIRDVSTFAVPSTWEVETDRGVARFVLKGEEDIRRVAESTLLIADSHGVQYLLRNTEALDKASKKLLDRFL